MDRVCQFYVVIGNKEFRPPNDGNVYINATGVMDNQLIKNAIYRAFNKKHNEKVQVGNEIIFLISDMKLEERSEEIMMELNIRGKVQLLASEKEEMIVETPVSVQEAVQNPSVESSDVLEKEVQNTFVDSSIKEEEPRMDAKIVDIQEYQNRLQQSIEVGSSASAVNEEKDPPKYSYQPKDNIYYGEFSRDHLENRNRQNELEAENDSLNYMGYNPNLVDRNVKKLVKRPKSAAFVHLPVIIFVLSALLLVASIILLFVLE